MATDPLQEMRLQRLENDRNTIFNLFALVGSVDDEHSERLDGIDARIMALEDRLMAAARRAANRSHS